MALGMFRVCLAFALLGLLYAAPLKKKEGSEVCNTLCVRSDLQRKGFEPGQSYHYSYESRSLVEVEEVSPRASSLLDFTAEVILTLGETCDLEVVVKDPKVNGVTDRILEKELAGKRMLARYDNGVITTVCADPEDYPAGLNLKKGILSAVQNILPELPPFNERVTLKELDVLGECPTEYYSFSKEDHYLITKSKNHKECKKDFTTADESPVTSWWLRSSALSPIDKSHSDCYQIYDAKSKDFKEGGCKDIKTIRTGIRSITAKQENKLKLTKIEKRSVKSMDNARVTDLHFEVMPKPQTEEVLPAIKKHLTELCLSVEHKTREEAAVHVQELISYMKSAPKDKIKELHEDIKKGEFCQKYQRLESLYLDIIAYVDNAGAVELMVDEVVREKVSGGRTPLYALALHLQKKPCINSVKAVSPLFDANNVSSSMVLAAGTLVRKYCKFHHSCLNDEPVKEILQKISQKLDSTCSSTKEDREKRAEVLAVLKAVGNLASISSQLENSILKCLESKETDTYVRVAAAQAYRHASCQAQPTEEMLKLAVNSSEDTEVRIASYVAAIRCADYEQAKMLVSHIAKESNTQVRSFILSHLHNLQKSNSPHLCGLRYNLTTLLIPIDYEIDLRKYSRDIDLSYYLPTLGLGAGVESGVIYSPGSYIPRQIQTNLTMDLFDSVINIGEFAVRFEDLDAIMNIVFGPGGILESSHAQTANELFKQMSRGGSELKDQYERYIRKSGKKVDLTSLHNILSSLSEEDLKNPKIDVLSRIFGKEVMFASFKPDPKNITPDNIIKSVLDFFFTLINEIQNLKSSSARAMQLRADYLVPTAQGIPVQIKGLATAVAALDDVDKSKYKDSAAIISPAASFAFNVFVGHTFGAKVGLRLKATALFDPKSKLQIKKNDEDNFEVVLDIPEKVKVFDAKYKGYTMTKLPDQNDQIIDPKDGYPTYNFTKCYSEKDSLGIEICVDLKRPDYKNVEMSPLGDITVQVEVKKDQPDKELLKVTGNAQYEDKRKSLDMKIEAPGSSKPLKLEFAIDYQISLDTNSIMIYGRTSSTKGRSIQLNMKNKLTSAGSSTNYVFYIGDQRKVTSADQVMVFKMKSGKKEQRSEIHLATTKSLKKHIDVNLEVDIVKSKHGIDIRKLEAQLIVPTKFNSTTYVRKDASSTSSGDKYKIYSLTRHDTPVDELLRIEGTYETEGDVSEMTHKCKSKIAVKFFDMGYDIETKSVWTKEKKQAMLRLKDLIENELLFYGNVLASEESFSSKSTYSTLAELQIPSLIPSIKVNGSVEHDSNKYDVSLTAKRDDEEVLLIKGPIVIDVTSTSFKQRSELKVRTIKSHDDYVVKSKLFLSRKRKDAMIDITNISGPVFSVEVEMEEEDTQMTSAISLLVPKVVDAKLKVERTLSSVQVVLNGFLKQKTSDSRRVQGSASVDLDHKEAKAKLAYDLERDPKKKIELVTRYDFNKDRKYVSVKGDLVLHDQEYKYAAETALGVYSQDPSNKNTVRVRVIRPDGSQFDFESECSYREEKTLSSIDFMVLLQTEADHLHKIESKYSYDFHEAPALMKLVGETKLESPVIKKVVISIDVATDIKKMGQKGHGKFEIIGEKISKPIQTNFEFNNEFKKLMANANVDLGSSSGMKFNGHTHVTRDNQLLIQDASVDFTVDLSKEKIYNVKFVKSLDKLDLDLLVNGKKILSLEQESPEPNLWSAKLTTPLRRAEIQSKLTDESVKLSVYPDRKTSEDKYEAEGHFKHSQLSFDAGAKLKYPGSDRELSIQSQYAIGEITYGDLKLDIFRNPQDQVVIKTALTRRRGRNYRLEADINVPKQQLTPRFVAELDLSEKSHRFEILVQKAPKVEPTFIYILDLNKPTEKSYVVYSKLKTPSDKIEMISELRKHELLQCRGKTLNGTIMSKKLGTIDFKSAVCDPGYLELGAAGVPEHKMFMTKIGMKRPDAIKFAVDLVYDSPDTKTDENSRPMESTLNLYGKHEYVPKRNALLVGARLFSPIFVSFDVFYNRDGFDKYMEEFVKPAKEILQQLYTEVLEKIPHEFKEKMLPHLPKMAVGLFEEIKLLKNKLHEEVTALTKELGITSETIKEIEEAILKHVEVLKHTFRTIYEGVDDFLHKMFKIRFKDIKKWIHHMDKKLQEHVVNTLKAISRFIYELFHDRDSLRNHPAIKWLSSTALGKSIWEWFKEEIEALEEKLENAWKAIKDFFNYYYNLLKKDIKILFHKIMNITIVKKFVKWVESWFTDDDDWDDWFDFDLSKSSFIGSFASKFYGFYQTPDSSTVRLQIPLKSPVSSLSAAVTNVGIPISSGHSRKKISESSFVKAMTQPSGAYATMEKGTLVTFDGLEMPVIFSKCEILMAKVFDDKLTAKMPNEKKTELKIQLKSGQDFKIQLEEGKVPYTSLLKESSSIKVPGMEMKKLFNSKLEVELKGLKITMEGNKFEVKAKSNSYSKVEGLMGNYDNEKGNDAHHWAESVYTPHSHEGHHRLTKKSARELMEKFRISRTCQIPQQ